MYLIYVDDSGDEARTILTGLAIPEHRWTSYLKGWLTWRKQLFRDEGVPAGYELHAQEWLSGTPAPVGLPAEPVVLTRGRDPRRRRFELFEGGLHVIGTFQEAKLFTVATPGTDKSELYRALLGWIDEDLREGDAYGLVIVDGLDQGRHFRRRHRDLPIKTRRLLEDPVECPSNASQLIQMADWCVHAAFRHVRGSDKPPVARLYPEALQSLIVPGSDSPSGIRYLP